MKKTPLILFLLLGYVCSKAQSSLSVYGGLTASKILKYGISESSRNNSDVKAVYGLPPLLMPYVAMEYEYDYKSCRLSTGLSLMTMGASSIYAVDRPWGHVYLVAPLLVGKKWELPNNFGLTIEGGAAFGLELVNISVIQKYKHLNNIRGNIGAVVGVEGNWKNLKFGTRFQLGLTTYDSFVIGQNQEQVNLKHSAWTTYVGYTFWQSAKAKRWKQHQQVDKISFD